MTFWLIALWIDTCGVRPYTYRECLKSSVIEKNISEELCDRHAGLYGELKPKWTYICVQKGKDNTPINE